MMLCQEFSPNTAKPKTRTPTLIRTGVGFSTTTISRRRITTPFYLASHVHLDVSDSCSGTVLLVFLLNVLSRSLLNGSKSTAKSSNQENGYGRIATCPPRDLHISRQNKSYHLSNIRHEYIKTN